MKKIIYKSILSSTIVVCLLIFIMLNFGYQTRETNMYYESITVSELLDNWWLFMCVYIFGIVFFFLLFYIKGKQEKNISYKNKDIDLSLAHEMIDDVMEDNLDNHTTDKINDVPDKRINKTDSSK